MAKDAESKAQQAQFASKSVGGPLDLDNIFTALAKDASSADASGGGAAGGSSLEADLDALLAGGAIERSGTISIKKGDGVKTIRRKKRIEQKVAEVEAHDGAMVGAHDDEQFNPADYPLIEYADKWFNEWPRKCVVTKMHNPENVNLACSIFKDLHKYVITTQRLVLSLFALLSPRMCPYRLLCNFALGNM